MRQRGNTASEQVIFLTGGIKKEKEKLYCLSDVSNTSNAPAEQSGDFFLSI